MQTPTGCRHPLGRYPLDADPPRQTLLDEDPPGKTPLDADPPPWADPPPGGQKE